MMAEPSAALSVSELNEYARKLMARDPLLRALEVNGEISGFKRHYSGHCYFSLKDESARVQCVMFRQNAAGLEFQPLDGMRVTVRGSASIFARDGSFQLYVTGMRKAGQGDLFARFEKLKQKLLAEGLFDPARKREIPAVPRAIGVATSHTGAAIRDIINVARRRNPNVGIVVAPCAVQGEGAALQIARAIERLNRDGRCDVILAGRGGGSIEDLWAFNEEVVARAIAASAIPVVSCVGHETDFTIADFVADMRAPTPSAAAELAVPELEGLRASLDAQLRRLCAALRTAQQLRRANLERLASSQVFKSPDKWFIAPRRDAVASLEGRCRAAMPLMQERRRHRLGAVSAALRALDPEAVLDRGYAVVRQNGAIADSIRAIDPGLPLSVSLSDGELVAEIADITPRDVTTP